MKKCYFELEMEIISFSQADDVLALNGSNENFDNGTSDGDWEDF